MHRGIRNIGRVGVAVVLAWVTGVAQGVQKRPATRPVAEIERVMIVSIDGGRPDLLLRGDCPTIRGLMAKGSYTFWAETTAVALTLPSHVSMLTGVIPVRHGIHWNEDLPLSKPYYPKVPTIFELAHRVGYTTAVVTSKAKFDVIAKPGTIDWSFMPGEATDQAALPMEKQSTKKTTADDDTVVEKAGEIIREHRPDVMFVHFASGDVAGHGKGWGSAEHIAAIEHIDRSIGKILEGMPKDVREHTMFIVSADHGGAGRTHGADDERSRNIPWIISGPGVRKNFDLTGLPDLRVTTYDTFATACWLMGIPVQGKVEGRAVVEAMEGRELLGSSK